MILGIDLIYIIKVIIKLSKVIPYTMYIVLVSFLIGVSIAIVITCLRIKKINIIEGFIKVYISFFRSTPAIIHLFLFFYGVPVLLNSIGIDINWMDKSIFCILSLSLFNGAYISEIFRPSYLAVDRGQHEAAISVGMSSFQKNIRIIVPQMLPIALPGLGNAIIDLIKDTSILFLIGLTDIMGKSKILISQDYGIKKLEVYIAAGLIYWVLNNCCVYIIHLIEKNISVEQREIMKGVDCHN